MDFKINFRQGIASTGIGQALQSGRISLWLIFVNVLFFQE
jgi:hypothetical protein